MRLLTEDQKISTNKRIYVRNSRAYHYCLCGCRKLVHVFDNDHKRTFYRRGHGPHPRLFREKNGFWKGGKTMDDDGYILVYCPDHPRARNGRYVLEQVFVFEHAYNCCLLKWSIVHHKDENKQNNTPSNLEAMMRKDHRKYHPQMGRQKR